MCRFSQFRGFSSSSAAISVTLLNAFVKISELAIVLVNTTADFIGCGSSVNASLSDGLNSLARALRMPIIFAPSLSEIECSSSILI